MGKPSATIFPKTAPYDRILLTKSLKKIHPLAFSGQLRNRAEGAENGLEFTIVAAEAFQSRDRGKLAQQQTNTAPHKLTRSKPQDQHNISRKTARQQREKRDTENCSTRTPAKHSKRHVAGAKTEISSSKTTTRRQAAGAEISNRKTAAGATRNTEKSSRRTARHQGQKRKKAVGGPYEHHPATS
ncbi:hypothetical protein LXL04_027796 [Taraxacum kok-saghyz]